MASTISAVRGMRDFVPSDKEKREHALRVIRESFSNFGYREIETPALEEIGRLTSGLGGENEKMIFAVLKRGLDALVPIPPAQAADLGLRFDLTLPLARFVATNHAQLGDVNRLMQLAPVWRAERPQKGRYRQFMQCDIDMIGEPSVLAESELIIAMTYALESLGIKNTFVRLNDREILYSILRHCGFPADQFDRALISLDKLDKVGVPGVTEELLAKVGAPREAVELLHSLLERFQAVADQGDFDAVLKATGIPVDESVQRRMYEIRDAVDGAGHGVDLRLDVSLVRGMGYYTGPIFEVGHPSSTSSLAGGGRYDTMIGRFLQKDIPACGFSIGFERILDLIDLPDEGRATVAVFYDEGFPLERLMSAQAALIGAGYKVRLVRAAKRRSAQFARLYDDGVRFHTLASDVLSAESFGVRPLQGSSA